MIAGCALPDLPRSHKGEENAGLPVVSNINSMSEMTQIALEWQRADDPNVAGYILYRIQDDGKLKEIATIKDRFTTHYVDTKLAPSTQYSYSMVTYDKEGMISVMGPSFTFNTLEGIAPMEFAQVISELPNKVKLIWSPHEDKRVTSYVIERSDDGQKFSKVAEVKGRLQAEYIDNGLKPSATHLYRISAKTSDGVLSAPSLAQSATTKALPNMVMNLSASTTEPKKITLRWEANTQSDIKHYVIYSSRASFIPVTKLATTQDTSYDDYISSNGATRYYKVTAVDHDGLEGKKQDSAVEGSTLPAPAQPQITRATNTGNGVEISWSHDANSVKFNIYKESKGGDSIISTTSNVYFDSDIVYGQKYSYKITAIDQYGLESDKSDKVVIEVK